MFPGVGFQEIFIIGIIAVILFGKRLPEVARSVGKSYQEFRKGLTDVTKNFDVNAITTEEPDAPNDYGSGYEYDDYEEATAPKFEPPGSDD